MSKLYSLISWMSPEDAAKRLTISFGEVVTSQNVWELVIEGRLALSWFPGRLRVKPVDKIDGEHQFHPVNDTLVDEYADPPTYQENEEAIITINTVVRLDLDDPKSELHEWLALLRNSAGDEPDKYQLSRPTGFYVDVGGDKTWRVMELVAAESVSDADLVKGEDGFYRPRALVPKRAELVIQRKHLEHLERTALKEDPERISISKRSRVNSAGGRSKEPPSKSSPASGKRIYSANLRIIAALLKVISPGIPAESKRIGPASGFESEAKLIQALAKYYAGYEGIKKTTLEKRFAAAKKLVEK